MHCDVCGLSTESIPMNCMSQWTDRTVRCGEVLAHLSLTCFWPLPLQEMILQSSMKIGCCDQNTYAPYLEAEKFQRQAFSLYWCLAYHRWKTWNNTRGHSAHISYTFVKYYYIYSICPNTEICQQSVKGFTQKCTKGIAVKGCLEASWPQPYYPQALTTCRRQNTGVRQGTWACAGM